ncbi:type II toxin-antitoxin system HipA family toxin, partial [Mycobacterium sp. ITM-2017-0098]
MATRALHAFLDGTPVGTVTQSNHGNLSFSYDNAYADQADPTPLSLSLPLLSNRHRDKAVRSYLEGLLPDSEGARQRWGREYNVSPNNPFALLAHVGRDAAGAVQLLPPDDDPTDVQSRTGDVQWLSDTDLADLVQDLTTHQSDWDPGKFGGRWSLAGAQPKVALFRDAKTGQFGIPRDSTPTTVIVKPAVAGY